MPVITGIFFIYTPNVYLQTTICKVLLFDFDNFSTP